MNTLFERSLTSLLSLEGKTAIVTGSGMGIGRAIAYRLAEAGANVVVSDIDLEAAQETVKRIAGAGGHATAVRADVSQAADAQRTIDKAVEAYGDLDILVNNAGIYPMKHPLELDEGLWNKTLGINLTGTFLHAQAAARAMKAQGHGGRIVNIASVDAFHPSGDTLAHYDASKGGVLMLTKALALAFGKDGIRVTAVAPGAIQTEGAARQSEAAVEQMRAAGMSTEQIGDAFTARIPIQRQGVPDDIARAVVFLASGLADYVTGHTLVADGGYLVG